MFPLTVNGPIPFGWQPDGSEAAVELRQRCALVVGETGSGKSVVLHDLTAGLVRCPDALVWHIDLAGAGLALPWVGPWLDGYMARPVVDWVAPSVAEALIMTDLALQIIGRRRMAYRHLLLREDADLLPLSAAVPGIWIVLDEGAEAVDVTADPRLRRNITAIVETGRSVGVRAVLSTLRATSDILPARTKRQLGLRIGMRVTDEEELNQLFGWRYRVSPDDFPHLGSGLWRDGAGEPPARFRSWHMRPSTIARAARACERWRPTLDGPSLTGPGRDLYETRWARVRPILEGEPEPPEFAPVSRPAGSTELSRVDRKIADARLALMPQPVVEQRWAGLVGQLRAGAVDPWARMLELLDQAGPGGLSGSALLAQLEAEGLPVPQSTLYDRLARHPDVGKIGYRQYVHRRHRGLR